MAESAEELHARVSAAADEDGRFAVPATAEWDQLLPPGPEDVWRADLAAVAAALAARDGRSFV